MKHKIWHDITIMIIKRTEKKLDGPLLSLAFLVWLLLLNNDLLLLFDNDLRRGGSQLGDSFRKSMEMAPTMCFREIAIVSGRP